MWGSWEYVGRMLCTFPSLLLWIQNSRKIMSFKKSVSKKIYKLWCAAIFLIGSNFFFSSKIVTSFPWVLTTTVHYYNFIMKLYDLNELLQCRWPNEYNINWPSFCWLKYFSINAIDISVLLFEQIRVMINGKHF